MTRHFTAIDDSYRFLNIYQSTRINRYKKSFKKQCQYPIFWHIRNLRIRPYSICLEKCKKNVWVSIILNLCLTFGSISIFKYTFCRSYLIWLYLFNNYPKPSSFVAIFSLVPISALKKIRPLLARTIIRYKLCRIS